MKLIRHGLEGIHATKRQVTAPCCCQRCMCVGPRHGHAMARGACVLQRLWAGLAAGIPRPRGVRHSCQGQRQVHRGDRGFEVHQPAGALRVERVLRYAGLPTGGQPGYPGCTPVGHLQSGLSSLLQKGLKALLPKATVGALLCLQVCWASRGHSEPPSLAALPGGSRACEAKLELQVYTVYACLTTAYRLCALAPWP